MKSKEKRKQKLTPKQEKFCVLYTTKEDFFGNGVQSYIEAYQVNKKRKGAYAAARTNASRLLTNADILRRIDELNEESGLNNAYVDKQLYFLITQHADLGVKLRAVQEYNKLRARYKLALDLNTNKTLNVNITNYQEYQELLKNKDKLSIEELEQLVTAQVQFHKDIHEII